MKVRINPKSLNENAIVHMPPSKSLTHRAIIAASLADGVSRIENVEYSDDINATIAAMRKLQVKIETYDRYLIIHGINNQICFKECEVNVNESASTLRFLIPLFALHNRNVTFIGKKRLFQRPMQVYQTIFAEQKLMFKMNENFLNIHGKLQAGEFHVRGDVSSQFVSGLLFALPLLEKDSVIYFDNKMESSSYIQMSIALLKQFQIQVKMDEQKIIVYGKQRYQSCNYKVEGDFSQFAFFAILGALKNGITCLDLNHHSLQGDKVIVSILKKLNVKIEEIENGYRIHKSKIGSGSFDLSDAIDLAPILCVLGMYSEDMIYITNAHRLEYKEANRKEKMVEELRKLHVDIQCDNDTISIQGGGFYYTDEILSPHFDHRIFMSLVIVALTLDKAVIIKDAQCMNKSFPTFIQKLKSIGASIDYL